MKNNGNRYCPKCGNKLKKKGYTSSKKQRWFCKLCRTYINLSRTDVSDRNRIRTLTKWIMNPTPQRQLGILNRTTRRKLQRCWSRLESIKETGECFLFLIIDGIYVKHKDKKLNEVCLIAHNGKRVVAYKWVRYETTNSWNLLFDSVRAINVIVCDGNGGMLAAIRGKMPNIRIQRCQFHIAKNIRNYLTRHPEYEAGKWLIKLVSVMKFVKTKLQKEAWIKRFNQLDLIYTSFLNERTPIATGLTTQKWKRTWSYTHRNYRSAYRLIREQIKLDTLFTYLEFPGAPNTTNLVEGGINSQLRTMLKNHRGMSFEHRKKAIELFLFQKSLKH